MTRIIVEFRAEDEPGRELLEAVGQFPPFSVERAEMEAHLFMVMARVAWREADQLRALEHRTATRRATRRAAAQGAQEKRQ